MALRLLAVLLATLASLPAIAGETLTGRIVGVTDGDTITVLINGRDEVKVRLHGVDCPERGQAFGNRAKQFTSELCFGQTVTVKASATDRFGRTIGEVVTANGTNVNVALVESGLAWWYEKYAPGDARLRDAQEKAKAAKRGLWVEPGPTPPWEYRKKDRDGANAAQRKSTPAADGGYWLTRSSNKRHNSGCEMYRKTNGRPCGPDEGIPCKICGG